MKIIQSTAAALLLLAASGCGAKLEHEVKPIHMTIDVNVTIKIDNKLQELFSFEDQFEAALQKKK